MLWSSERHQVLSGWLEQHDPASFNDALKLQKYLFFYEVSAYQKGDPAADFSHLRGYVNGPVFSNVYGDYRHRSHHFCEQALRAYQQQPTLVDTNNALQASFMVAIMNDEELSDFTHEFNVWNKHQTEINRREAQVSLSVQDLTDADFELLNTAYAAYPVSEIEQSVVIPKGQLKFLFSLADSEQLTPDQEGILELVVNKHADEFENPVYVSIAEDGALEFD